MSDPDLEAIVIEIFGKFKNTIQNSGSKLETIKINQKAVRELRNKHVQIKQLDRCSGTRASGLNGRRADQDILVGPLNTKARSTSPGKSQEAAAAS